MSAIIKLSMKDIKQHEQRHSEESWEAEDPDSPPPPPSPPLTPLQLAHLNSRYGLDHTHAARPAVDDDEDDVLVDGPDMSQPHPPSDDDDDDDASPLQPLPSTRVTFSPSTPSSTSPQAVAPPIKVERTQSGRTLIRASRHRTLPLVPIIPPPPAPTNPTSNAPLHPPPPPSSSPARSKRRRGVDDETRTAIDLLRRRRAVSLGSLPSTLPAPTPAAQPRPPPRDPSSLPLYHPYLTSPLISPLSPPHPHGWELTPPMLLSPFIVDDASSVGLSLPTPFTVALIHELVGPSTPISVIDVSRQQEVVGGGAEPGWTLARWRRYWYGRDEGKVRRKPYNVISLEVSDTPLAAHITRPHIIDDVDWLRLLWPSPHAAVTSTVAGSQSATAATTPPPSFPACPPPVSYYCLMSTAGSWTDFHIDFAGTAVYYHVVSGSKVFFLLQTNRTTLRLYEEWTSLQLQLTTPLLDFVSNHPAAAALTPPLFQSVTLTQGQTLFLPPALLHAVYTPEDSIVLGGNYLSTAGAGAQVLIDDLERRSGVEEKYRMVGFRYIGWMAGEREVRRMRRGDAIDSSEVEGIASLAGALLVWWHEREEKKRVEGSSVGDEGGVGGGQVSADDSLDSYIPYANGDVMARELMLRVRLLWMQDEVRRAAGEEGKEGEEGVKGEAARHAKGLTARMEQELKAYEGVEYVYAKLPWEIPLSSRRTKRKRRQTDVDDGDELMDPAPPSRASEHTANGQPAEGAVAHGQEEEEEKEEEEGDEGDGEEEEEVHVGRGRKRAVVDDSDYEEDDAAAAAEEDDDFAEVDEADDAQRAPAAASTARKEAVGRGSKRKVGKKGGVGRGGGVGSVVGAKQRVGGLNVFPLSMQAQLSASMLSGVGGVGSSKYALPGQARGAQVKGRNVKERLMRKVGFKRDKK